MNRLQHERSPYLLQHADNPVDWFPWSDEAFAKATAEGKPVFLSIGYSSCHWCHVMEEESFSNDQVAALLNESYVSVKVDREERPDVDSAYMTMAQIAAGQAGWPLTVIMTPDGRPFFVATYIPRTSIAGRVGLLDLLPRVAEYWQDRREELIESADRIIDIARRFVMPEGGASLAEEAIGSAVAALKGQFDRTNGGFGSAPKFPMPSRLSFLLHNWWANGDNQSLEMVTATLDAMRLGGIYDHVGAGFHRYSVDANWNVPHFEKMLYDQALLSLVYIDTYRATGDAFYADTARDVLGYVVEMLQSPEGGICSSEDADSEGREGKFYTWTVQEMSCWLTDEELKAVLIAGGMLGEGDSPDSLSDPERCAELVLRLGSRPAEFEHTRVGGNKIGPLFRSAMAKLGAARATRVRPALDDKVVADWNGLAIGALARCGRVLDDSGLLDGAVRCADFVLSKMRGADGGLLHTYRAARASVPAFLDDYAFMVDGLLELYQATQESRYLREAVRLTREMVARFWDEADGAFFQAASDAERMLVRMKPAYDGAMPSGNSVAASVLVRVGRLTDDTELTAKADRLFEALASLVDGSPAEFTHLLSAYMMRHTDSYVSIVAGDPGCTDTRQLVRAVNITYAPGNTLVAAGADGPASEIAALIPAVRDAMLVSGRPSAHVCTWTSCSRPATTPDGVRELLSSRTAAHAGG